MTFNVNAARARRLEAAGEDWPFEFEGTKWHLPRELPLSITDNKDTFEAMSGTSGLRSILELLLGDQAKAFPFNAMSQDDLGAIFEAYQDEVGASLGESSSSSISSMSTATPSKPTSKPRMASSSRKSTKAR